MNRIYGVIKRHAADIIIITIILFSALAIALYSYNSTENITARVLQNGEIIYSFELNKITESSTVTLDGGIEILVEKGAIGFIKSDCPDKICVHSGALTRAGEVAVCVPNKAVIKLVGSSSASPDIIAY